VNHCSASGHRSQQELAGQVLAIREVGDQVSQVSFLQYDLGYFDRDQDRAPSRAPGSTGAATLRRLCVDHQIAS
jgi:hypothetical protein